MGAAGELGTLKETYPVCKEAKDGLPKRKTTEAQGRALAVKRQRAVPACENNPVIDAFLERDTRSFGQHKTVENNAPTDFTGLIPKSSTDASQQQQQQDGCKLGNAAAAALMQPKQRTGRTFEDIARQHTSRTAFVERPPADWMPPSLAPLLLPATAANLTSVDPTTAGDRQLLPSTSAPVDWSLKTTVRLSSATPFAVCEEAAAAPARDVVEAQRCFAACSATSMLSLRQQLLAALLTYQFPHDTLGPHQQQQPGGGRPRGLGGPTPAQLLRRQAWQASFCSLYDAFRTGRCDAFYCVSPEGSRRPFVAFFGAAGVGGRPRVHAILTRTTAGLRMLLEGSLGLGLATPLMPGGRPAEDLVAPAKEGTQSMAAFEGALRVHGLFDFLLNESFRCHGDDCDVPLLLAPTQFLHASLVSIPARQLGVAAAPAAAVGAQLQQQPQQQHRMDLQGLLPPWVVDRLVGVLAVTQDAGFSMAVDTHPLTLALNWRPSRSGGGGPAAAGEDEAAGGRGAAEAAAAAAGRQTYDDHAARESGCWDAEEARRWRAPPPGLACNVLREVRCVGRTFSAVLSTRSAERAL